MLSISFLLFLNFVIKLFDIAPGETLLMLSTAEDNVMYIVYIATHAPIHKTKYAAYYFLNIMVVLTDI